MKKVGSKPVQRKGAEGGCRGGRRKGEGGLGVGVFCPRPPKAL